MTYMLMILDAAALGDSKLCGRCCDLLAEALAEFPEDPAVWTWALYALIQLASACGESGSECAHTLAAGPVVTVDDNSGCSWVKLWPN